MTVTHSCHTCTNEKKILDDRRVDAYIELMEEGYQDSISPVPAAAMTPFLSLTILEITIDDLEVGYGRLVEEVGKRALKCRRGRRSIAASGIQAEDCDEHGFGWAADADHSLDAMVVQCEHHPGWMKEDHIYTDREHKLVILLRRRALVAVHADLPGLRDSIQSWLDNSPPPPFRRITEGVMHAAFIRGDAKGLWLRGTHARRTTKADSKKNISGRRLSDALLPHEDSSFAMGSARAALPSDINLNALSGIIGSTPRKSQMWARATASMADFLAQADDALSMVEDVMSAGITMDQPYPLLARKEENLGVVKGAFDFSIFLDAANIASVPNVDPDLAEAAELLSDSILEIQGSSTSSNFVLQVGEHGAICGSLSGRINAGKDCVTFNFFGYKGEPTNGPPVRRILTALNLYADSLLTIYFESGHTVVEKALWKREIRSAPFPNWEFHDLRPFDITCEKPPVKGDQKKIHDAIGVAGDTSLFAWVVQHYANGWLICDDGSGEVADFIHISPDRDATLSLIHVKGAASSTARRQIAVGPYEVVSSQAAKKIYAICHRSIYTRRYQIRRLPGRPAGQMESECRDGLNF